VTLPNWTREPLVHFLAAGLALFLALTWSSGGAVDPASRVIEVDRETQAQLALQLERTMGRAPTDAELDAAIAQYVHDEVLYREALRLGLDQDDAIVRRRLVAKMDMSASAAAEAAQPDKATLRAWYKANRARYAGEAAVSFDQLYFADEARARRALAASGVRSGDPISLPASVEAMAPDEVTSRFGEVFAAGLSELAPGKDWQGPLRSGFGWHLVRLQVRSKGAPLPFEDVRSEVENDWRSAEIAKRQERAFEVLRAAYRVDIAR
jgi:hypothetical protein